MRMRIFLTGLAICLFSNLTGWGQQLPVPVPASAAQDQSEQKGGVIKGKVTAVGGDTPLAKAVLWLRSSGGSRGERPRTTRTDSRGEYEFRDLKPGKYVMRAARRGYVRQSYGQRVSGGFSRQAPGTTLSLSSGEVLSGIDFELVQSGVVEGRVVDQDNEPVSRVSVMLSGYRSLGGERGLMPVGRGQTDDRGRFRLFDIPPGSYFLSASASRFRFFGGGEPEERSFPPTWYPGVLSPEQAAKVQVDAGGEVGGFHITLIEALSYSVSGRVLASDGRPAHSAWIMTVNQSTEAILSMGGRGANTDLQGHFKVADLLPGKYRLIARTQRRGEDLQLASTLVDVADRNVEGLTLVLGTGGEFSGRIVVEGEAADLDWRRISLGLWPAADGVRFSFGGGGGAEVEEDLTFRISNLLGGLYRFSSRLPPGRHYVESVRVEGQDIIDREIELRDTDRLAGVEVVVSSRGSGISGLVRSEEAGEAAAGATVLVFAADSQYRGRNSRFTRTTQTDQGGRFSLEGLVPAEYLVCALFDHQAGRQSEPDYLQSLEGDSEKIDLSPEEAAQLNLVAVEAPGQD